MVEVIFFPKKCPHCKDIMFPVKKMYSSWLECRNKECPHLQIPQKSAYIDPLTKEPEEIDPEPFTCCYNRR